MRGFGGVSHDVTMEAKPVICDHTFNIGLFAFTASRSQRRFQTRHSSSGFFSHIQSCCRDTSSMCYLVADFTQTSVRSAQAKA